MKNKMENMIKFVVQKLKLKMDQVVWIMIGYMKA